MDIYHRMLEIIVDEMTTLGLPRDRAVDEGVRLVSRVSSEIGGQSVYFPKRAPWISRPARDQRIRERFDGRNYRSLAREFRISERTVRRIVKK